MTAPLRVLIVEDSQDDALLALARLRRPGQEPVFRRVETAEALATALREEAWDLVIADYSLPHFSAPEALAILRRTGLDLPFIVVSGKIEDRAAVDLMKAGAHDYIMKGNLLRLPAAVDRELAEAQVRRARRRAEDALWESEQKLSRIMEHSPDIILTLDRHLTIDYVNHPPPWSGDGRLIGRGLCDALPPADRTRYERALAAALKNSASAEFEYLDSNARCWLVRVMPIGRAEPPSGAMIILTDVTEHRMTERALEHNQALLVMAQKVQEHLLPEAPPALPGYDIAGATLPAEFTAGDYFDYIPMRDGLAIAVGDVCGHGLGPALIMASVRAYLRSLAQMHDDVCQILTAASHALVHDTDEDRFVTLMLAHLNPEARSLVVAGAGHPEAYVLDARGAVKEVIPSTGYPLGVAPEPVYEPATSIRLDPGDTAVFLTDGLLEARSPEGIPFGLSRTLTAAVRNLEKPAGAILDALCSGVRTFCRDNTPVDDITAVVLKVTP